MQVFKLFVFVFLISISILRSAPTKCPFEALTIKVNAEGGLDLTDANYKAFAQERANFREAYETLTGRFKESEHAVKTLFMALMGETHGYIYGEAGGAKSAIARAIMNMPILNPETGNYERSVFSIQMNQLLSDTPFRGFVDMEKVNGDANLKGEYEKLKGKVKSSEVQNRGSMIQFDRALVDELEKGNPIAAAALLDVLNEKIAQYGSVVVKANTKTVATTSNMTPYEFLEMMTSLGMESTAKPFLDRLVYKIYVHNWITDQNHRIAGVKASKDRRRGKKEKYLNDPKSIRSGKDAEELNPDDLIDIKLPPVNFPWLGAVADRFNSEADLYNVVDTVFEKLRAAYGAKRIETMNKYKSNPQEELPPYFPPFIFSTRNYFEHAEQTVHNSLLMDLMLVPESKLPSDKLIDFLSSGEALASYRSSYRAAKIATTNAVGEARMIPSSTGNKWTLEWGTQLDRLIESPLDNNEKANRVNIKWEREKFTEEWEAAAEAIQNQRKASSNILQEFAKKLGITKSKGKIEDVEELLFYLKQQQVVN